MHKLPRQAQIWNRACLEGGGPGALEGDRALAAALLAHGLVENGGVVHALEALTPAEIAAAVAGFRYFGLAQAAQVLEQVPDDTEETEERLNQAYRVALPGDDALTHAFRLKLLACPEAFAPTDPRAHA